MVRHRRGKWNGGGGNVSERGVKWEVERVMYWSVKLNVGGEGDVSKRE